MLSVGCSTGLAKKSDVIYEEINPDPDKDSCISDELAEKLLTHNCKVSPENEYCPDR